MRSFDANDAPQRRITGTLFVTESLFSAAFIASVTLLAINATQLTGTDALAGIPGTIQLLGRAAFAVPVGWLMDRAGRRVGLVLGYALGMVGFALNGMAVESASFLTLCFGALLAGMANGSSQQARFVASEVWPADRRARVIGFIVFAGTVGAILGPLLVAPASSWAERMGLAPNSGPYLVGAALTGLACILAFALLRPDPLTLSRRLARQEDEHLLETRSLRTIFSGHTVQLAVASMVVGQMVMSLIMVITPVHMYHEHHTTGEISLVYMAHTLGMFGFAWATGGLIGRLGSRPMIAFGAGLLILASLMAIVAGNVLSLALALFVLGLGWNFCFVAGSVLLSNQLHPGERGRVQGFNDMLVALASGTATLSTGVIFASGGMLAIGAVGLAATLAFVALGTWLHLRSAGAPAG